jgi:gluconolactonase
MPTYAGINCPSPNGLVLSPDEKALFVTMTRGNSVWRVPLQADGSVSKVGQFFTSHGPSGPDGLTIDSAGRLICVIEMRQTCARCGRGR